MLMSRRFSRFHLRLLGGAVRDAHLERPRGVLRGDRLVKVPGTRAAAICLSHSEHLISKIAAQSRQDGQLSSRNPVLTVR